MTVATLGELGRLVDGQVRGATDLRIEHALPLQDVTADACITLVDKPGSLESLLGSRAVAAVVPVGFPAAPVPTIEVQQPHAAFERIIRHLRPATVVRHRGVHIHAHIDPSATIGPNCVIKAGASVGPGSVIGARSVIHPGVHVMAGCVVGEDCELYPGVVLYANTRLGNRCLVHAGSVLGAFGFGYRSVQGRHERSAQVGWVELGDDVELGACVTIDRGTYGATRIGEGTKIDNQVMIGHNCQIGRHNLICAQVGIAGSSSTGDYVVLAGQVGLKDHIHLSDRVMVAAKSGVMHDIPAGEVWSGYPAQPSKKFMQSVAGVNRLPELRDEVRRLERESEQMRREMAELRALLTESVRGPNSEQRAA
ncbi:MAG: UDP-3-O-(3-hydroxymyristoyl)glucosamine N-acyltransferase [Aureliella sp.]